MEFVRVYALLIGQKLPKEETHIRRCVIKKMSLTEQKKRKFKPIKHDPIKQSFKDYSSYVANRNNDFDQRVIKTNYVIYTDIETGHFESVINAAYSLFEDVVSALNIDIVTERKMPSGDSISYFYSYEYQIVKLYKLVDGKEVEMELPPLFNGGSYSKLNFPTETVSDNKEFKDTIENYIDLANNNPNLKQAVEYLSYAERCMSFRFPTEMAVLNLCKAIETLFNSLKFKGKMSFKEKLKDANDIFNLTSKEISDITKLWDERSKNDVAHAAENYMYAMTYLTSLPASKNKMIVVFHQPPIVAKMIKNYADFVDRLVHIKVNKYTRKEHRQKELSYVVNRGYYTYDSNEKNLRKLVPELKKRISNDLNIPYREIKIYYKKDKSEFLFKIENKFNRLTKKQSFIIFGR